MPEIKISPEAAQELEAAVAWYEKEQTGLGNRLILAFEHTLKLLTEPNPPLTPVEGEAAKLGAKKLILHIFPFSVITIKMNQTFVIVALAHHARKPGANLPTPHACDRTFIRIRGGMWPVKYSYFSKKVQQQLWNQLFLKHQHLML